MSLLDLLVKFPTYPARRVRRLARQIDLLQTIEPSSTEPLLIKGMVEDLTKFNIEQAKQEARFSENPAPRIGSMRVNVTPVDEARRALAKLDSWMRVNTDANLKKEELDKLIQSCTGIITGSSFYADRPTEEEQ